MARFYGTVQGSRGEATRLGHSELYVTAQSFSGDIVVKMHRGKDDIDRVHIYARDHSGGGYGHTLYQGAVKDILHTEARDLKLKALGLEGFTKRFERGEVA